mgnify:FL=1
MTEDEKKCKEDYIQKEFDLREKRLKLVYKILYLVAIAWGILLISFMKIETHTESSAGYCGLLTITSIYLASIVKYILKELSCMKITEYIPEEERKNVDILYANIWKNALKILVSACALMILNIWLWEIFSRRENQKTVQMILSVFFVLCIGWFIYSACKKNSKNKVFSEINIYIPVFFAYSIYAMLMIV